MSDSNKDLYGDREILENHIELKRNFIPASIGMLLWRDEATLCKVFRSLLISSRLLSANYASAMQQSYWSRHAYKHCISGKITNIYAIVHEEKGAISKLIYNVVMWLHIWLPVQFQYTKPGFWWLPLLTSNP